jgi:hypothetical protein
MRTNINAWSEHQFQPGANHKPAFAGLRHSNLHSSGSPRERESCCERKGIFGIGEQEERSICTSHVERHNLTIRTFLKRFTRLALGFSKKLENLTACVCLYIAYYNYCWMHGSLPGTPAMAAGIAGHPWSLEELVDAE